MYVNVPMELLEHTRLNWFIHMAWSMAENSLKSSCNNRAMKLAHCAG